MKVPAEVLKKIAELGQKVLDDDTPETDIGEEGAIWLRNHQNLFVMALLEDWWRKRTRSWIYTQTRDALADDGDADGQMRLPFPELHTYLEIAPGVMKHQAVMTGTDWDHTLAIYRNRREQADVLYRQIERRYNQIRDLLVDDLTTADVLDQFGQSDTGS